MTNCEVCGGKQSIKDAIETMVFAHNKAVFVEVSVINDGGETSQGICWQCKGQILRAYLEANVPDVPPPPPQPRSGADC